MGVLLRWHNARDVNNILVRTENEQLYGIEYLYSVFKFLDLGVQTYYANRFVDVDLFVPGSPSDLDYDIFGIGTSLTPKVRLFKSVYLHGKIEIPLYEYETWERTLYVNTVPGGKRIDHFVDREYFGRDYNIYIGLSISI